MANETRNSESAGASASSSPSSTPEAPTDVTVARAVKIAGERFAPGASLMLDGDVRGGVLHTIAAGIAARFFGPIGFGLVALNSYSKSTSGKNLHEHLFPQKRS
jgi:hypothetical protein